MTIKRYIYNIQIKWNNGNYNLRGIYTIYKFVCQFKRVLRA